MITVMRQATFDAAHFLPDYEGLCSKLHGHRWKLEVYVERVNYHKEDNMVIDFHDLDKLIDELIINKFDHSLINDYVKYPTAEKIVWYIVDILEDAFVGTYNKLVKVALWETENSCAIWEV